MNAFLAVLLLLDISDVLAVPFDGKGSNGMGYNLMKRGQELCPALYPEPGPVPFFAFPDSVYVGVISATTTTTTTTTAATTTTTTRWVHRFCPVN